MQFFGNRSASKIGARLLAGYQLRTPFGVSVKHDSSRKMVGSQSSWLCSNHQTTRLSLWSSVNLNFRHSLPYLKFRSRCNMRRTVRSATASSGKSCPKKRAMVFDDQRPCWRAIASRYSMPTAEPGEDVCFRAGDPFPRPFAIRSATLLICDHEHPVTSMMSRICRPAKH